MPRNIDDMIAPGTPDRRRSIRDIPIPEGRRKTDKPARSRSTSKKSAALDIPVRVEETREEEPVLAPRREPIPSRRRGSRKRAWAVAVLVLIIGFFGILSLFDGATLSYVPKSVALAFEDAVYTAQKTGTNGLFYSVVKLSRDKGVAVPVGAEEDVSRKASGVIVIYNNASAEPQQLIENTRFESPDGKIYRIQKAISIPGKTTVNGEAQPGKLEVTVYADQPGESYNIALADFTVPGLKGTPRYSTIYARSKTPMSGGFVGREKVVIAADAEKAKATLQESLKEELWQEAESEVPEDFILFRSLSSFVFEDLPQTAASNGGEAMVNSRGHLYGVMFKRSDLSGFLAKKKVTLAEGEIVDIVDFENLALSFAGTPPADILPLNEINFKVTGNATAVWRTDEIALRADLSGRHKNDVPTILNNYPTIASATARVRPFWKSSLPSESSKISIKKLAQ